VHKLINDIERCLNNQNFQNYFRVIPPTLFHSLHDIMEHQNAVVSTSSTEIGELP